MVTISIAMFFFGTRHSFTFTTEFSVVQAITPPTNRSQIRIAFFSRSFHPEAQEVEEKGWQG